MATKLTASAVEAITKRYKTFKGFDTVLNNVKFISVENGNCLAELVVEEAHTNPMGTLHGGFSATLVDSISSVALGFHENIGHNRAHVSLDIHTTYIKSAKIGDTIQIEAKTIRAGRTIANLEVLIKNKETGDLLVKGTHTKYIMPPPPQNKS